MRSQIFRISIYPYNVWLIASKKGIEMFSSILKKSIKIFTLLSIAAVTSTSIYANSAKTSLAGPPNNIVIGGLSVSPDDSELYMISIGGFIGEDDALYAVDATTGKVIKKIKLKKEYTSSAMEMSKDGKNIYIAANTAIVKVDTANKDIAAIIPTGNGSSDRTIAITPDGLKTVSADYADYSSSGFAYVHIADTQANALVESIPKNNEPTTFSSGFGNVTIDHAGKKAYLEDWTSVSILDLETNALERNAITMTSDNCVGKMAINSTGTLLYVSEPLKDVIDIIDLKTKKIIKQIKVGSGSAARPTDVVIAPDDSRIYVVLDNLPGVAVVDLKTDKVIKTESMKINDIQLSADGKKLYTVATGYNGSGVNVLDAETFETIATYRVKV